ncbi:MAG: hypothetical protein HY079_01480, partial [Elusimicrobia bacterium]|nr:hypothetical protein [Elusimicrobiota bacterium]
MRRPLVASVLLSLAAAALAAREAPPAPGDDFVSAACDSGVLVQRDEKAAGDGDVEEATAGFDDLTGGDEEPADGDKKKKASPKPKKKPKTRLLRPKAGDKDKCPDRMRAFYASASSRGLNAVLAPKDVPAEELRAHADDAFAAMSPGSKKGERLADLGRMSKSDIGRRVEFANRLFDNAGPLASVDFKALGSKADGLQHGMDAADKAAKAAAALGAGAPADVPPPAKDAPPAAADAKAASDAYTAAPGAGLPGGMCRAARVPEARP